MGELLLPVCVCVCVRAIPRSGRRIVVFGVLTRACAHRLWMSVGGFLVSLPVLNVFWKYVFHYIDYQSYVFQGMMVNEFKERSYACETIAGQCSCMYPSALQDQCRIAGTAVLSRYGYALNREGQWVGIMIAIIAVYRLLGWAVTWFRKS